MKFFPLVWKNLCAGSSGRSSRSPCIFIAFLLFGFLMTIRAAFSLGVELAGVDRLVLMHKVSLIMPLPVAYLRDIEATPGVTAATHNARGSAGRTRTRQLLRAIAIEPQTLLQPVPGDSRAARSDEGVARRPAGRDRRPGPRRIGSAGRSATAFRFRRHLAAQAGQHLGVQPRRRSTTATPAFDKTNFFFRYDYFDENRRFGQGDGRLVHRQDRRPARCRRDRAKPRRACSPTRRPRRRRRPRRHSSRASRTRSATSAPS